MNALVIYNPKPSKNKKQVLHKLELALRGAVKTLVWFFTEKELAHTKLKFDALNQSFDLVIVVGGDGTLHQAVNLLVNFKGEVGYIPAGTGNDFGRHWLGKRASVDEYIDIALHGEAEPCDIGKANERYFINSVGIGFDGALIKRIQAKKSWLPIVTYIISALKELFRYRGTAFFAQTDNGKINEDACLMFVVANAPYYGAGMCVVPHANPQDGILSYTCVEDQSFFVKLLAFVQIFKGDHVRKSFVTTGQFERLRVKTENLSMHADGEYIGETPVDIRMSSSRLLIRKKLKT